MSSMGRVGRFGGLSLGDELLMGYGFPSFRKDLIPILIAISCHMPDGGIGLSISGFKSRSGLMQVPCRSPHGSWPPAGRTEDGHAPCFNFIERSRC
jgi:hypothetical protein